ncbi:hypothetical protein LPJ66_005520, partial [Kickxella alabastrina]
MKLSIAISTLAFVSVSQAMAVAPLAPQPPVAPPYQSYPPRILPSPNAFPVPAPVPVPAPAPVYSGGAPLLPPVVGGVPVGPAIPAVPGGIGSDSGRPNAGSGADLVANGCVMTPAMKSALTPLLTKLGLAKTVDEVKDVVNEIVVAVRDLLDSDGISQLLKSVNELVKNLGLGGLDLQPAVSEVTSILRYQ